MSSLFLLPFSLNLCSFLGSVCLIHLILLLCILPPLRLPSRINPARVTACATSQSDPVRPLPRRVSDTYHDCAHSTMTTEMQAPTIMPRVNGVKAADHSRPFCELHSKQNMSRRGHVMVISRYGRERQRVILVPAFSAAPRSFPTLNSIACCNLTQLGKHTLCHDHADSPRYEVVAYDFRQQAGTATWFRLALTAVCIIGQPRALRRTAATWKVQPSSCDAWM